MTTLISDPRVRAVPIRPRDEALVDLREVDGVFVSDKRIELNPDCCWVRESIATSLLGAARRLPAGHALLVEEGFRPLSVQRMIFDTYLADIAARQPGWTRAELTEEALKYVAEPVGVPPHASGGAVDVVLADSAGRPLSMGSDSDAKPIENEDANRLDSRDVSAEAKALRGILAEALSGFGFVNYEYEWWHWSIGDQYWAFVVGAPYAVFGPGVVPEDSPSAQLTARGSEKSEAGGNCEQIRRRDQWP